MPVDTESLIELQEIKTIDDFLENISSIQPQIRAVYTSITTNPVLSESLKILDTNQALLKRFNLFRLNIDEDRYKKLTGWEVENLGKLKQIYAWLWRYHQLLEISQNTKNRAELLTKLPNIKCYTERHRDEIRKLTT